VADGRVPQGLDFEELAALTRAMMASGEQYDLSAVRVSRWTNTVPGGVGDKFADPRALAACAGVRVPMVSGRSLGHTGGTLDKLESIPGPPGARQEPRVGQARARVITVPYREQFISQISNHRLRHHRTSDNFVPADKIFYSCRDVTGTIESIP